MTAIGRAVVLLWLGLGAWGCAKAEAAAAKDPANCERDPNCAKQRGTYVDCTRQCVDDPECVHLCEEIQAGVDQRTR